MSSTKIVQAGRASKGVFAVFLSLVLVFGFLPNAWADEAAGQEGAQNDAKATAVAAQTEATQQDAAKSPAQNDAAQKGATKSVAQKDAVKKDAQQTGAAQDDAAQKGSAKKDAAADGAPAPSKATPKIAARAHVQTYGWMATDKNVKPADVIGTQGKAKRVEALCLSLSGKQGLSGSIQYRTYVQTYGWMPWVSDGAISGTQGKAKRVEAIEIKLTGQLAQEFDIYYQAHVQKVGWTAWAKNGEPAGSSNLAYRMEALRIQLVPKGQAAPGSSAAKAYFTPQQTVRAHVQKLGTVKTSSHALTSTSLLGTTGQSKRLEAISIAYPGKKGVSYEVHVAKRGWLPAKSDGTLAGTTGRGLGVQAVKIKLSGELAQDYDVYYRAHVQKIGWMGWTRDGAVAGTTGCGLNLEALQVKLVAKGGAAPGATDMPSLDGKALPATLKTTTATPGARFVTVGNGAVAGTTGKKKALSAFGVQVSGKEGLSGSVKYQAHFAKTGWKSGSDGAVLQSGGNRLQAVRVSLTGGFAKHFDVYYRAHVSGHGWMGWAKNGASSGTTGLGKNIEAVQVKLVSKGKAAPGSTARAFSDKNGFLAKPKLNPEQQAFMNRANGLASKTNWLILTDTRSNRVCVMQGSKGNWKINRIIPCTSGAWSSPTVKGTFSVTGKGYAFGKGYTCYYYTQFYGNYLFHSVLYNQGTFQLQDGRLGINASHGCVRLALDQAKWIYDTIPYGTKVVIY